MISVLPTFDTDLEVNIFESSVVKSQQEEWICILSIQNENQFHHQLQIQPSIHNLGKVKLEYSMHNLCWP